MQKKLDATAVANNDANEAQTTEKELSHDDKKAYYKN